jgi:hypothetical protein
VTGTFDPVEFDASSRVEEVFQRQIERLGDHAFDATVVRDAAPGVRMLVATRAVEGQVDNGGWAAVFYNEVDGLLEPAIAGYRRLGLDRHAALAERISQHGFKAGDNDAIWEKFDDEWFALPSAELARAEYIESHPEEFGD